MLRFRNDYISKMLSKGTFYESHITDAILRWQLKYGGDILDLGVNIGSVLIPVAAFCKECNVIGIEMVPETFRKAKTNVEINRLEENTILFNKALVRNNSKKFVYFQKNIENMGGNFVNETIINGGNKIETTTLDSLQDLIKNVKVMKMDIEGSEMSAMEGGMEWLSNHPPCVIIMEATKINSTNMKMVLHKKGFKLSKEKVWSRSRNIIFKNNGCIND